MLHAYKASFASLGIIICLISLDVHPSHGQTVSSVRDSVATEATLPTLQQQCAAILSAIQERGFDSLAYNAPDSLKLLGQCDASAGIILPQVWQQVNADSTTLTALMWVSASVRDKRIAQAAEQVLMDRNKPVLVRQIALHTLVSYGGIKRLGVIRTIEQDTTDTTYKSDTTSERRWTVGIAPFNSVNLHQREGIEPLAPHFDKQLVAFLQPLRLKLFPDSQGRFITRDQEALFATVTYGIQCYTHNSNL